MKHKFLTLLICSAFIATPALALAKKAEKMSTKDKGAISWLIVLNTNEINAAKVTLKKSSNNDVKTYAKSMIKDHTKNLTETKAFDKTLVKNPEKTDEVKDLKEKGAQSLKDLKATDKKEYDAKYVTVMIDDHEDALKKIDDDFMDNIDNAKLKEHFKNTRTHVDHHLTEAKALKEKLPSQD